MKLIIDLDDGIAKGIRGENDCNVEPSEIVRDFQATIADAIRNGIPYEERLKEDWIPIKTRPLTEEEKEIYPDYTFIYDCRMPEDGEEVLVTTKYGVYSDRYYWDDCGCYFEDHYDDGEVLAWKPLPEPYKEGDKE
jgi:hypothetical protein